MHTTTKDSGAPAAPVAFSVGDAARAAGNVSPRFLYLEMAAGRLRSKRVGKRRLIPADALKEWIAACPDA